jgi:hypothetical protein
MLCHEKTSYAGGKNYVRKKRFAALLKIGEPE